MDRALFLSGVGAREQMRRQATQANNLANVSTQGFKAEIAVQRTAPVLGGPGLRTRAYAVETTTGADSAPGPMMATGRDLDLAVQGNGWFAIQRPDGEAYTRNGSFVISQTGDLTDVHGNVVMGEGGAIAIPDGAQVIVGSDGTLTAMLDDDRAAPQLLGRLKLVNPDPRSMERGADGLFRMKEGGQAAMDEDVQVASGFLEGSNVNSVQAMVNIISSARQFEMQIRMVQNIDKNQETATRLLSVS